MEAIADLIAKVLQKRGLKEEAQSSWIVFRANEWMHSHIVGGEGTRAIQYRDATLIIAADTPIGAQECHLCREDLLVHLRELFPQSPLDSLRIIRSRTDARQCARENE